MANEVDFSQKEIVFQGSYVPEYVLQFSGYAALISAYGLKTPQPAILAAISEKHQKHRKSNW